MQPDTEKKLYTIRELAKMKGISIQAMHVRVNKSRVPVEKFGRTKVIEKKHFHLLGL